MSEPNEELARALLRPQERAKLVSALVRYLLDEEAREEKQARKRRIG